jgi:UDP-GlcNAc3NAcA epimerase
MYDALLDSVDIAKKTSTILNRLDLEPQQFLLATVHRAENTDQSHRLESIVTALDGLARAGYKVIFPVHPRTKKLLKMRGLELCEGVVCIDPVAYMDMVLLESTARVILTDSGGIQKEAYWLKVPCVTPRNETELKETVESGWNRLVGTDPCGIFQAEKEVNFGSEISSVWKKGEASRNVARLVRQYIE